MIEELIDQKRAFFHILYILAEDQRGKLEDIYHEQASFPPIFKLCSSN